MSNFGLNQWFHYRAVQCSSVQYNAIDSSAVVLHAVCIVQDNGEGVAEHCSFVIVTGVDCGVMKRM